MSFIDVDEYLELLNRTAGRQEFFGLSEKWRLIQAWRERFAAVLHAREGKRDLRFEWHVFSYGYARSLNGARALEGYEAQTITSIIVCPQSDLLPACRIVGGSLPDFQMADEDISIWPEDLSWTMCFTHEAAMGLGPYFSRSEWLSH
jgi:hypothetical protein